MIRRSPSWTKAPPLEQSKARAHLVEPHTLRLRTSRSRNGGDWQGWNGGCSGMTTEQQCFFGGVWVEARVLLRNYEYGQGHGEHAPAKPWESLFSFSLRCLSMGTSSS